MSKTLAERLSEKVEIAVECNEAAGKTMPPPRTGAMGKTLAERLAEKVSFAVERSEAAGKTMPSPRTVAFADHMNGVLIDARAKVNKRQAGRVPFRAERSPPEPAEVDEVDAVVAQPLPEPAMFDFPIDETIDIDWNRVDLEDAKQKEEGDHGGEASAPQSPTEL